MKICGVKLTHDGAVAGINNGKLIFCVEAEKLNNNPRYSRIDDFQTVDDILTAFDFDPDHLMIDGWKHSHIPIHNLPVASYHDRDGKIGNLLDRAMVARLGHGHEYSSFPHITGHVFSAYCTAPFSKQEEDAYVITWDGGQNPRVHFVSPRKRTVEFVKSLFDVYGVIYGIMGRYFGPFKIEGIENGHVDEIPLAARFGGYDVPGKIMSYIAQGKYHDAIFLRLMGIYFRAANHCQRDLGYHQDGHLEHIMMRDLKEICEEEFPEVSDADILLTIHTWLETMLVDNAKACIPAGSNLAFAGGSALNIKWNSALRNSGHFKSVWVPPFPNDAGSAIGQACALMAVVQDIWTLDWSVYCGMYIKMGAILPGWSGSPCSLYELAGLLTAKRNLPVLFLHGRAEAGPRALGNRSILMSAADAGNKDTLNKIKGREAFRPVAPICLEEDAPDVFDPGMPDPYMLFDHQVREGWKVTVPAIVHIDGSARLQTVSYTDNPDIYELLTHYKDLSGIPLLCNTSANGPGTGFFPDIESAMRWGKVSHIWTSNFLFIKEN